MSIDADALGQALVLLIVLDALVTAATWVVARRRTESPGLVTACNFALGLFPPFNLAALTLLAMLPVPAGIGHDRNHHHEAQGDVGQEDDLRKR